MKSYSLISHSNPNQVLIVSFQSQRRKSPRRRPRLPALHLSAAALVMNHRQHLIFSALIEQII